MVKWQKQEKEAKLAQSATAAAMKQAEGTATTEGWEKARMLAEKEVRVQQQLQDAVAAMGGGFGILNEIAPALQRWCQTKKCTPTLGESNKKCAPRPAWEHEFRTLPHLCSESAIFK